MKLSRGLSLILLLVAPAVTAANAQGIDLTGLWADGSGGGGVYRVRQMGTRLYWIVDGTSKGSYVNMMFGEIAGNMMHGKWVDLPGSPTLGGGDISMRIESNNRFVKISSSTHYGPHTWTRLGSTGGDVIPPGRAGRYLSVRLNGRLAVVNWLNAPTSSGSWVSIVPVGTSDGAHAGRWLYTGNTASGRYENGPLDPGAYEARFYADAGYGQLVDRVRFELGAETPPVIGGRQGQILRVQVDGGPNAIVTWANAPTSAGAWVSVVPTGTAESTHIGKWTYTNQTAAGRYEAGPLSPGAYEARFYADDGYGQLVERVRFEVGAQFLRITGEQQGQILRVQVDGRAYAIVTWSNAPISDGAWVSVVPVGTAESTHVGKWTYTNRTAAGKYEAGPLSAGEYEARFYGDGGYGRLIERVRFRVQ